MVVSILSILVNFALNWFLTLHLGWGHQGLALSTSLVAITNFLFLFFMMRRYANGMETAAMLNTIAKLSAAGAVLAAVCFAAQFLFFAAHPPLMMAIFEMMGTIAIGAAAFFGTAYLFRVTEVHDVAELVRRRLGRRA